MFYLRQIQNGSTGEQGAQGIFSWPRFIPKLTVYPEKRSALHPLWDNRCFPGWEATPGTVGGAVDCANYLRGLGTRECRAPRDGIIMYRSRGTIIKSWAINEDSAASYCVDVAAAIGWVLDHCPACGGDGCAVAGTSVTSF